ncbi:hypothetical protein L596_025058 [Steinernema carpocapsae]|uniref:Uncharacterized protein n=1 Tax=Steinernema carpocapsae TaxID=34508 RepID=A0A4U5M6P6_STECR|nr:hypothetical protein L596_025058 [Steinernema carpocapsae]
MERALLVLFLLLMAASAQRKAWGQQENKAFDVIRFMPPAIREFHNMMDDMMEALFLPTDYSISYAMLHYMHMRDGLGLSRTLVRKMFPNCEKLAKIPELQEFYGKRRGENPNSLRVLKDFMELLEWMDYQNKLGLK